MGTWSSEPFGNDSAADWAWELEDTNDWSIVRDALTAAADSDEFDSDDAVLAIAAAEVVAHGLGRPTQEDDVEEVTEYVKRMPPPPADLVSLALRAVAAAGGPDSALAELWEGDEDWQQSNALLTAALRGHA